MKSMLKYLNPEKEKMLWKIMSSMKVTNKMVRLLSAEMKTVHKDTEI